MSVAGATFERWVVGVSSSLLAGVFDRDATGEDCRSVVGGSEGGGAWEGFEADLDSKPVLGVWATGGDRVAGVALPGGSESRWSCTVGAEAVAAVSGCLFCAACPPGSAFAPGDEACTRLVLVVTTGTGAGFLPEIISGGALGGGAGLGAETTGTLGGAFGFTNSSGSGGISTGQGAEVTE